MKTTMMSKTLRRICRPVAAAGLVLALAGCDSTPKAVVEQGGTDEQPLIYAPGQPAPTASVIRDRAGYDTMPEWMQSKLDRKIEKKINALPTTGPADAMEFFMHQRVEDGEDYPIARLREIAAFEYAQADAMAARDLEIGALRGDTRGSSPIIDGWQPLGPGNVGGRTRALLISPMGPGDGTPDSGFMLAAGVSGGIFKSIDGGASWSPKADLLENIAISTLAMDPTDDNIIYAGTGEGFFNGGAVRGLGIFKSEDAGETWTQLPQTVAPLVAPSAFHYVNKIAVSRADPKRIYAATRTGVWVHKNAGEPVDLKGDEFVWENLLANPALFGGQSVSQGSAAGATDVQVRPAPTNGSAGLVENEIVMAAFGTGDSDGLFISINGGDAWFRIVSDSDSAQEDLNTIDSRLQGRMSIAFSQRSSASDPGVVYVLMARNSTFAPLNPDNLPLNAALFDLPFGTVINLFRADLADLEIDRDAQDNVTDVRLPMEARMSVSPGGNQINRILLSNGLASGVCGTTVTPAFSQGWYDNIVKVDPANRNIVWAGGIDLFRSDDGGRNFGLASYWYFSQDDPQYVHADQHEIVFHPEYNGSSNTTMYVTNDGGIFRTLDARADVADDACPNVDSETGLAEISSVPFTSLNNGYAVTQFYHGDTGHSTMRGRDMYVGGTQDNGTVRSLVRDCTEDWTNELGGDGGYVAIDPTNSNIMYAETQNFGNIYRIENIPGFREGPTFISERLRGRDSGLFITPFAMDPNTPTTIWTGGARPWRTTNARESDPAFIQWAGGPNFNLPTAPPPFDFVGRVSAIAIAPSNSNIVYMGFENGWIARTQNSRSVQPEWVILRNGLPTGSGYISSIAVDPADADVIWVTNSRFTTNNNDANLYRGECSGTDCRDPNSWFFTQMDGFDCNPDDGFSPVLPDVPAHWVAIRRCDSGGCASGDCLVFVGTEIGVYVSDDAYDIDNDCDPFGDGSQLFDSVTWRLLAIGDDPSIGVMPATVVETLDFRDDNTIVAFTHGRGAFLANILRDCNGEPESKPCNPADIVAPFGVLDSADITAFTQDFATGRLSADMPASGDSCGDGVLDVTDLTRFGAFFLAGCP